MIKIDFDPIPELDKSSKQNQRRDQGVVGRSSRTPDVIGSGKVLRFGIRGDPTPVDTESRSSGNCCQV